MMFPAATPASPRAPTLRRFAAAAARVLACCGFAAVGFVHAATPTPPTAADDLALQARAAADSGDTARLELFSAQALAERHPLASWIDYWATGARLKTLTQTELDAFYARWPGSYVEDRLRNDWLLELGQRQDWVNFRREYPRFRMADDREVRCYWLLTEHLEGLPVGGAALDAWTAQRRDDDGCQLMARTLFDARRLDRAAVWTYVQGAVEAGRLRAATDALGWSSPDLERTLKEALDNPARYLARHEAGAVRGDRAELALAALLRLATQDPEVAAMQLARWQTRLPPALAARGWASTGRVAAQRLLPSANDAYASAWRLLPPAAARAGEHGWSDDVLAWGARAALREAATHPTHKRWAQLATTIDAMEASQRDDPAWVYWRARTRLALAPAGEAGSAERSAAFVALRSIAGFAHFYAQLALEDLGARIELPAAPPALSAAEGAGVRARPGFQRALRLIALGLRSEGVREWNFTLRDLDGDREFLAAAQWACEREVWDRCINTSDRTREQIDLAQRYPMPFRADVTAQARTIELDPAYIYGLIRQESRFVTDARSSVGASGLMQLMPATARWTARKIGFDFKPAMVTDRDVNLKLGTSYLKLVLDDFEGRMALGAAAYNAGPNRPRRWREGPSIEAAAWVENIPFTETRDYVKKVLSNAVIYGALLGDAEPSLKRRLGGPIGPRAEGAAGENRELP